MMRIDSMPIESDDGDWFDVSGHRWLRAFMMCIDANDDEK